MVDNKPTPLFKVNSPNVTYTEDAIHSKYSYQTTFVTTDASGSLVAEPVTSDFEFVTQTKVPRTGLMMVGLGGNNGTTVTAGIIANRENISWKTRLGVQTPNYFGSLTQASTVHLGRDLHSGKDHHVPLAKMVPMVDPNTFVIGGWDISAMPMIEAMDRAQVLEPDLINQLKPHLQGMVPLPSIYDPDFIASNQADRADNVIPGTRAEQLAQIRSDITTFRANNACEQLIIVWTANTERFAEIIPGHNDTADNLLRAIEANHPEVSPSTIFAVASILEGTPFINGSPQNTFVPGVVELAERYGVLIGGDDFKSGQTKIKSVLVDFLVGAGIKPLSITSYNHLGNNDGMNLSAPSQFRSKEISKSNVVDDMVGSNPILYKEGEHPDHVVVIKYVPAVGDSKRALDEYNSEIFLGGRNNISLHNTCEDSLLAAPLIIDLAVLAELFCRVSVTSTNAVSALKRSSQKAGAEATTTTTEPGVTMWHPIQSLLSYLLKAPLVPGGARVVNALFRQRAGLENVLRAFVGLPPQNDMLLEERTL